MSQPQAKMFSSQSNQTPERPIFNTFEWCRAPQRKRVGATVTPHPSPEAHIFRKYLDSDDFQKTLNGSVTGADKKPLGSIRLPPLVVRRSPQASLTVSVSPRSLPSPQQRLSPLPSPMSSPQTLEQARAAFEQMREPLPSPNKRFAFGFSGLTGKKNKIEC